MDGDNARSMEAIDLDDIRRLAALAEADEQALFAERPARAATQATVLPRAVPRRRAPFRERRERREGP